MDKIVFISGLIVGFMLGYITNNCLAHANTQQMPNICAVKFVGEMTMKEVLYCFKQRSYFGW